VIELTKENFEAEVLSSKEKVIVDFYSDGCIPCQALTPVMHKYEHTYGDKIKFASLNITKARRLAIAQKVLGLPVIAIYADGEKAEEVVKEDATPENIEKMVKKHI